MTRPTDDELEAMAARLYSDGDSEPVHPLFYGAAAMLRACKGRVKRLPRGDGEGGWTLSTTLLAEIRDEVYANEWDAPCAEVIEVIALSVEHRILAAIDPAPDQGEWDAAIEAAVAVAERRSTDGLSDDHPYNEGWKRCATITAAAIRALKKGQTND